MKLNLSTLNNKVLANFAQRIIAIAQSDKHNVIANHPLVPLMATAYEKFNQVLNKSTYSGKGVLLAQADEKRDTAYREVRDYLRGLSKLSIAKNKAAAESLYHVFEKFGLTLYTKTYAEQSALTNNLIAELKSAENQALINLLDIKVATDLIESTQLDFELLYAQSSDENADLRLQSSASAYRSDLENALRNFTSLVSAMKSQEGWTELQQEIEERYKTAKNS